MSDNNEISINFKDYISYTLHRWRWMFVWAVLLGLLFGGLFYIYKLQHWNKENEDYAAALEEYEEQYASYQQQVTAWQTEIDYQTMKQEAALGYIQRSVYYGLDCDNTLITMGDICIKPVNDNYDSDKLKSVTFLYGDKINYGINWNELGAIVNLGEKEIRELVKVEVDTNANVIRLRVLYPDSDSARLIIDKIYELAENEKDELEQIELFEASVYNVNSYYDRMLTIDDNRNAANNRYNNLSAKIEEEQKELDSIKQPKAPELVSKRKLIPMTVLLCVVGAIIGIILVFVVCYNRFVKKGIVYSAGEFNRISGINNLGVFKKNTQYPIFSFVDKLIDKRSDDYLAEEDDVVNKKIILNIKNRIKDESNILIIGNINEATIKELAEHISKKIDDIKFETSTDLSDSFDNVEKIIASDKVIVALKREKTTLPDLIKITRIVDNYDKEIIGSIIY